MDSTPSALLVALEDPNNREAQVLFCHLYAAAILAMVRCAGLSGPDAEDVSQDVLLKLLRSLSKYRRQPGTTFRGYLQTVVTNAVIDHWRRRAGDRLQLWGERPPELVGPEPTQLSEAGYRKAQVRGALRVIRKDFDDAILADFTAVYLEGRSVEAVAASTGKSPGAAYAANARVLRRVRDVLKDLPE